MSELERMSPAAIAAALAAAGLDAGLLAHLSSMTAAEAATYLSGKIAAGEAELAVLRDMLLNPNLTAEQRAEIEARIASLSSSLDLYRSLLASLVSGTPDGTGSVCCGESSVSHCREFDQWTATWTGIGYHG